MSISTDNTAKRIKAVQSIVQFLQMHGKEHYEIAFELCTAIFVGDEHVAELLNSDESRSRLRKIAYPDKNHADVKAALNSGSAFEGLYRLACGTTFDVDGVSIPPHILRNDDCSYAKARSGNGLKIIWRESHVPKRIKNALIAQHAPRHNS